MVKVSQFFEVWVLHQLRRSPPLIFVVDKHFRDYILPVWGDVWYQVMEPLKLSWRKVDFHVSCMLSEVIKDFFTRCPQYVMNLIDLVELIISREQRT